MKHMTSIVGAAACFALSAMTLGCSSSSASPAAATTGAGGSGAGGVGAGGASAGGAGGASAGGGGGAAGGPCSKAMFAKYGEAGFLAVNDKIIARATAMGIEAQIGDSFTKLTATQAMALKTNLGIFLINAYGGDPAKYPYKGQTMKEAHTGLGITTAQYNAFIGMVVVPALTDAGVSMDDITMCFAPVVTDPAFMATIVEKP